MFQYVLRRLAIGKDEAEHDVTICLDHNVVEEDDTYVYFDIPLEDEDCITFGIDLGHLEKIVKCLAKAHEAFK